jgi:hypothetical protein
MLHDVAEYSVTSGLKQHGMYTFTVTQRRDPEDDGTTVPQNIKLFTQ